MDALGNSPWNQNNVDIVYTIYDKLPVQHRAWKEMIKFF